MKPKAPIATAPFTGNFRSEVRRTVTAEDVASLMRGLTEPYGSRPATFIQKEAAEMIGVGPSQMSEYVRTGRIPAHHFQTLALAAHMEGDAELIKSGIPEGFTIVPVSHGPLDGSCDDQVLKILDLLSTLRKSVIRGDKRTTRKNIDLLKQEVFTFEAEATR
jgi:hypothetical protein